MFVRDRRALKPGFRRVRPDTKHTCPAHVLTEAGFSSAQTEKDRICGGPALRPTHRAHVCIPLGQRVPREAAPPSRVCFAPIRPRRRRQQTVA